MPLVHDSATPVRINARVSGSESTGLAATRVRADKWA